MIVEVKCQPRSNRRSRLSGNIPPGKLFCGLPADEDGRDDLVDRFL